MQSSSKLTESAIEDFAIKLIERLGRDCIHARMATDCSQLKMAVLNDRWIQLSGIAGQLTQTASNMRGGIDRMEIGR